MKISSYYKTKGHNSKLLLDYKDLDKYDKVFISKVFDYTLISDEILNKPNVEYGGTGFFFDKAPPLPYEIEHSMPDYNLYNEYVSKEIQNGTKPNILKFYTDYSIGFTTRGCFRKCGYCVNRNCEKAVSASPVEEFLDNNRKYIALWDDNVFAYSGWKDIFKSLQNTNKKFTFRQGLDERLLTDEKCDILFSSKWIGDYIFAFDNIADTHLIEEKLKMIRRHTDKIPKFYVFCGFNHDENGTYNHEFWLNDIEDIFKRIAILIKYQCLPYIMRHKYYKSSPYRGMYINLARWCNQPSFFKKKSFREFCNMDGNQGSCLRYMEEFEKNNLEIAKKYFDIKFSE
jgi:hypothetical protein